MKILHALLSLSALAHAQDTTAILEGRILDPSRSSVAAATVQATNSATGYTQTQRSSSTGSFHLSLPVGQYAVTVDAANFGRYTRTGIQLDISQTVRIDVPLALVKDSDTITVEAHASLVDRSSNEVGNVVTSRELVDLPLDGRNFTQLGLLQPGVAPITAGLAAAGGSLRGGQAYAVDGQRPESNNYLLDGVTNVNRVDGGYAFRTPVDAIQEFRILTQTAPPNTAAQVEQPQR